MTLPTSIFSDERANVNYWLSRTNNGDIPIFNELNRQKINEEILKKTDSLTDFRTIPKNFSSVDLKTLILKARQNFTATESEKEYYDGDGTPISKADYNNAVANCNVSALKSNDIINVRFALTKKRANLRLLPTFKHYFDMKDFRHYDDLQGTALNPFEPLATIHESADGCFAFVIAKYYMGWILKSAIRFVDREILLKYVAPKDYLVEIENKTIINYSNEKLVFQMGSVLPLDQDIMLDKTFNKCFLSCSPNNFIRQGFKFLGDEYDWGGMTNSVDCSSLVQDIYKSMGIEIPRDADCQEEAMPKSIKLTGLSTAKRYEKIKKAPIGSLFFKPGHVMMYIGCDGEGNPAVIHALSSFFDFKDKNAKKRYIRRVVVSDLLFKNPQGLSTVDTLTSIGYV